MLEAAVNTFIIAISVSVISFTVAMPLALIVYKYDFCLRTPFLKAWNIFYSIPSYVFAMAWISAANPTVGWLQNDLGIPFFSIYGFWGIVFVESCFFTSFLFLSILSHLNTFPTSIEEASRVSGASFTRFFFKILIPILAPRVIVPFVIVFLGSCASFGVPALLGAPARFHVFTTKLLALIKSGDSQSFEIAIEYSVYFGLLSLLFFFTVKTLSKILFKEYSFQSKNSRFLSPKRLDAFPHFLANLLMSLVLILTFVFPFGVLLVSSFQNSPGLLAHSSFSLLAWKRLFFETPGFWNASLNSLLVAGLTATSLTLLFFGLGFLNLYLKIYKNKTTQFSLTSFGLLVQALPGTVVALFVLYLIQKSGMFFLNDTLFLLGLTYFLKNISVAESQIVPGFKSLDKEQIQMARLCGANPIRLARTVLFPQVKPFLILAFVFVLLPSISEVTMTTLISGPQTPTLGIFLFELQEYSDKALASVVALCLVTVFIFAGLFLKGTKSYDSKHT